MRPIAVAVNNASYFSATSRRVIEPVATYSVAARTKCETWLRRQTTDPIPPKSITLIETSLPLFSSPSAIGQFALAHLEQRMQVTVNVSVIANLRDYSYDLCSPMTLRSVCGVPGLPGASKKPSKRHAK